MWELEFISRENFKKHISETIKTYGNILKTIDLEKFNSNLIDPVKLLFDAKVYQKTYKEIVESEISRQRDKSNTNAIGYFHQNIFKYVKKCDVPKEGFDVIYTNKDMKIYVEIKNKHNTMNSSSATKTMMKMQNKIMQEPEAKCYLVEVIAVKSQDIVWKVTLDKVQVKDERIRRVSIDRFWEHVTGNRNAFYSICNIIPKLIDEIIEENASLKIENDTAYEELLELNTDILQALYTLAFSSYNGFRNN